MTDTKRPEWMPTEGTVWNIQDGDYVDAEIESEFYRSGLRAQIAVLEDLPVRVAEDGDGRTYMDRFIQLKIAALRKELSA